MTLVDFAVIDAYPSDELRVSRIDNLNRPEFLNPGKLLRSLQVCFDCDMEVKISTKMLVETTTVIYDF